MFTGLIEEVGRIRSFVRAGSTGILVIEAKTIADSLKLGDSIAVNGVCLTARRLVTHGFQVDLSSETLNRSSLGDLKTGSLANLERPLLPTSRLGGHFVQGHVDGIGKVRSIQADKEFAVARFSLPSDIRGYVVQKGSIAVDGISLTVAEIDQDSFSVALIPHTLENTNLVSRKPGDSVNLECDVLAKYVESLLTWRQPVGEKLTAEYLKEQGY